jgi:predicted RNA-binding protein with EMAP domain
VAVALVAVANRLKMQSTLLMRAGFMGVSSVAMFILKKAVTTEITEVSEEKQEDTTNGLIPFG